MSESSLSDVIPGHPGGGLSPIDGFRQRPSRRGVRAAKRRRKQRRRRTWVMLIVGLLVIGGAAGAAWVTIKPLIARITAPNDWPGPGTGNATVKIPDGASGTQIAAVLVADGVVKTPKAFVDAYDADPQAVGIRPGVYRLRERMSAAEAVAGLLDLANRVSVTFTVPEGERLGQVVDLIAKALKVPPAAVAAQLKNPQLGLPVQANGDPEGWLYPSTRTWDPGTTPLMVLQTMVTDTVAELNHLGVPAAQWHSFIVEASLVQAEGGRVSDLPKIARVLQNRLAIGKPLQLDTTIHYVLKTFKIATSDAQTRIPSPYNTYLHAGLPPGAIDSPGAAAMEAVRTPAPGAWLYFVATDPTNGRTEFATTLTGPDGFYALQAKLLAWERANPGK